MFYQILQKLMDDRELTVSQVAKLSDLADSTVRSIIRRKQKNVALDVAFKISKGLNISLELLNGDNDCILKEPLTIDEQELLNQYRFLDCESKEHISKILKNEYKF